MPILTIHTKGKKQTETVKAVLAALQVQVEEDVQKGAFKEEIKALAKDIKALKTGTLKTISVEEFMKEMEEAE